MPVKAKRNDINRSALLKMCFSNNFQSSLLVDPA